MLGPFAAGVSGDGVTANEADGSVGGRMPTAGLTNGSVNRSAVYTQLYLGLFSRPQRKGYVSITLHKICEGPLRSKRKQILGVPPATGRPHALRHAEQTRARVRERSKQRSTCSVCACAFVRMIVSDASDKVGEQSSVWQLGNVNARLLSPSRSASGSRLLRSPGPINPLT